MTTKAVGRKRLDVDVTRDLLREGWYRRCADDPGLTDHLGARNCIAALLPYIEALEADLRTLAPTVLAAVRVVRLTEVMRVTWPNTAEEGVLAALEQAVAKIPPELLERLSAMEEA